MIAINPPASLIIYFNEFNTELASQQDAVIRLPGRDLSRYGEAGTDPKSRKSFFPL